MTTLQLQFAPRFQAPNAEDPMELTSDIDQRAGAGDDTDIDLDLTGDNPQDVEDEFMDEENMNTLAYSTSVDGQETHAANDDEMGDVSYAQGQVNEGSSVRDEDIEDAEYTGPDLDEDTIVEPDIDHPNEQSEEPFANYEDIVGNQDHEQDYQEQEYNERGHHEHPSTSELKSGDIERALPNGQTGLPNPGHAVAEVATRETSDRYDVEVSKEATVKHGAAEETSEPSDVEGPTLAPEAKLEQVGEEFLPASLDQKIVVQLNVEGSHTQEEDPLNSPVHLHPVMLDYQGNEMFLFPPVDQNGEHAATFLLADERLAYSPIEDLLEACRGILKGSLSELDELTINIDGLDLHISESTIESTSTRLSEVIELYVHLQQNDGLEDPPPLYMDLTSRNRFSRRLDLLQNAAIEGKGFSQLKSSQETENDGDHRTERETDSSSHTAVLSRNETYSSEQRLREDAEESIYQCDLHSNPLPSENPLLGTDSAAQGTQSNPVTHVTHEEIDRTEPQLGSDNNPHKAGISAGFSSEAAGSKESLEFAQPLAGESELQKAEESIVEDGDFIDYEDVEELEGGTSSASSTLQGDAIDVSAVQDRTVPNEPVIADNQEHRYPHDVQENFVADEEIPHKSVDQKDTSDVGVPTEEEQFNLAENLSQDSDDQGQSLSGQFNEEEEAPENDEDASISQETELRPSVNEDDDQHKASVQFEDARSYRHDTTHEHADKIEGDLYLVADTNFNGEIEHYSSTHPIQSEFIGSGRSFRDDDLREVNNLEAEDELEETDRSLANDDNDDIPKPPEGVNIRPSFFVDESAQIQEDDDEITYEDEEYDTDFPLEPAKAEHNVATSPGSLKRARSLHEDDDALEEDLQGTKRVRSG